jgi:uncharacterized protein (DUF736 family)
MMIQGIEIGAGWECKVETPGKEYVNFSIAASEFDQK